ncbi:NAD(P)H-dependent oxidoreductase [Candidatus Reidiella endopervernicosa]|uniref:NAD(P)H-dependent oxidoreductase n=1 Tax=Candidatus Reidiella endopervernicosa TaxID=2738883 RepID=UPI002A4E14C9|nr:NAD(P)H-dependent oxidoreductase [Candidatus Reidiella endopervernicosa]
MKTLLVTAHPLADSLSTHLGRRIIVQLVEAGHEVVVEDLYAEGFSPALTAQERSSYYTARYDSSAVEAEVKRLQSAEALVLLFPTWWFGFPAILKGWFDRVWAPGIAYDHASDYGPIKPRLDNLREVLVVTTLGSPWWVDRFLMWQPVKRIIKIALLSTCAKNSRLQFLSLYNCEKVDSLRVDRFGSENRPGDDTLVENVSA